MAGGGGGGASEGWRCWYNYYLTGGYTYGGDGVASSISGTSGN